MILSKVRRTLGVSSSPEESFSGGYPLCPYRILKNLQIARWD
jgi:hypothetical protein